jgi:hypothetical protein
MCLFTSALRASVNKSHIPSLPQNNLYIFLKKTTTSKKTKTGDRDKRNGDICIVS